MKNTLPRYIPENSTELTAHGATIYTYTSKDNKPAAIAYTGKSAKKVWHYRFANDAQRMAKIASFLENMKAQEEFKNSLKTARKEYKHDLKVGDILYASWGYEQTNIDMFQVTAVTEKTATFGAIWQNMVEGSAGFMCEDVVARPDAFKDDKRFTRVVGPYGITFAETEGAYALHLSKWDGRPLHASHYA